MQRVSVLKLTGVFALIFFGIARTAEAAVIVNQDGGTTFATSGLTGFETSGAEMAGMTVTAFFSGGGMETTTWTAGGGNFGAATGAGWSLSVSGNQTFNDPWTLVNNSGDGITRILIEGTPMTVFDRTFGGSNGTIGSSSGRDFSVISGLGSLDIVATYRDLIALTSIAPVGDLFRVLDIQFTAPGGAFSSGAADLVFIADTDTATTEIEVVVPEPTSVVIFGILAVGSAGFYGWRRRNRANST